MSAPKGTTPRRSQQNDDNLWSDAEIAEAELQIERAFELLGLVETGMPVCPECGENRRGKVKLDLVKGKYKCFPGDHYGYALNLMKERHKFPEAVGLLLGRLPSGAARKMPVKDRPKLKAQLSFKAVMDVEVYKWILSQGSLAAAQQYYARWHIAPEAVAELGCTALPLRKKDLIELQREMVAKFDIQRLAAAGVAKLKSDHEPDDPEDLPRAIAEAKFSQFYFTGMPPGYPVIEPHITPLGHVRYMQFRPDGKLFDEIQAHKAGRRAEKAAKAAGVEFTGSYPAYKPTFMSLRGASHESMVGGGLPRIAAAVKESQATGEPPVVVVVEGLKDLMAARTMGAEAYAIPGAKTVPPPEVLALLKRCDVRVALDGDEAGQAGKEQLIEQLLEAGLPLVREHQMPQDQDVTDILVSRKANSGCDCATCAATRQ